MENNVVLDIIIEFVKAVKSAKKEKEVVSVINGKEYKIKAAGYLLGQIVRQYNIPEDHYYISVAAENKWKELSNENIWDFVYRDSITCTSEVPICVEKYKNNEKTATNAEIIKGQNFIFRDIFHDEHIIPIRIIIENLINLEELSYQSVEKVLSNIYVCRILKWEDRKIKPKSNRPFDFELVKKQIYEPEDIILKCRIEN